jgi:DNA-binding winged helix-turn-helix (wHTH) protein
VTARPRRGGTNSEYRLDDRGPTSIKAIGAAVLLEQPGKLVTKQELMARVWPNLFVEPANLTVHISALRRALRDGRDGNRFIINIPGRAYRFVASIKVPGDKN